MLCYGVNTAPPQNKWPDRIDPAIKIQAAYYLSFKLGYDKDESA